MGQSLDCTQMCAQRAGTGGEIVTGRTSVQQPKKIVLNENHKILIEFARTLLEVDRRKRKRQVEPQKPTVAININKILSAAVRSQLSKLEEYKYIDSIKDNIKVVQKEEVEYANGSRYKGQ